VYLLRVFVQERGEGNGQWTIDNGQRGKENGMSIIDEMREKASDLQGVGEYWLAEHLEAWADRLAASVALVPIAETEV
jgi:hypothetical protein